MTGLAGSRLSIGEFLDYDHAVYASIHYPDANSMIAGQEDVPTVCRAAHEEPMGGLDVGRVGKVLTRVLRPETCIGHPLPRGSTVTRAVR